MPKEITIRKIKTFLNFGSLIAIILGLITIQIIFANITTGLAQQNIELIQSYLNDRKAITNPYLVSMKLEDLENQGIMKCTKFSMKNDKISFIDMTYKSQCSASSDSYFLNRILLMRSLNITSDLKAADGNIWQLETQFLSSKYLKLGLWLSRILFIFFILAIYFFCKIILDLWSKQSSLERKYSESVLQLTSQVSHDIRSPLSALNMVLSQIYDIPEQQRLLIRNSVNRINDIANELLKKGKEQKLSTEEAANKTIFTENEIAKLSTLIAPLIDGIVSEKRVQYREKYNIEIEADIFQGYGLFANINTIELKRTLSNLINNSIEAFPNEKGKVIISVKKYDQQIIISIQDNGKGIPEHVLKKLGGIGISHGKEGTESGSGLGIYHAKKTVENAGGKFQILSQEGAGTNIIMTFERAPAPKWFLEKLNLQQNQTVLSLDDDISIHQIWSGCFESKDLSKFGIQHQTFTSGNAFKSWFATQNNITKDKTTFLIDYELLNQSATGLDIIEELAIGNQSILVTSRYEEDKIRERCEKLGVKLIPKAMAGYVPIEIEKPRELFDAILIDDDPLPHMTWQMVAKEKSKNLLCFFNPEDFFVRASTIDFKSNLYIDSNLGNGIKGEDVAKKAFEMGFKEIYLCTGYEPNSFPEMHYIKKVIGKGPDL